MKIKRRKQAKHILSAYRNFFGFREPYQILVDGTFCKMSVQYNVPIKDNLGKYLQSDFQCLTTRCVLNELEMLGESVYAAKMVAQRFQTYSCSHRKKPVSAQSCLKLLIGNENSKKFVIATQDFELTKFANQIPGVPVLYFHQNNLILDKMSEASLKRVNDISQGKAEPTPAMQNSIQTLKMEANLISGSPIKKKRKRPGGPNSLSCKKSKKLKGAHQQGSAIHEPGDRRRKKRSRRSKQSTTS
ncbi:rRNA-processing protein UTP23 homolog [Styela clava]